MDGEENIEKNTNIPNVSTDYPIGYSTSIAALRTIKNLEFRYCSPWGFVSDWHTRDTGDVLIAKTG